jgi:nicotinamidase-related amidase
MPVQTLDARTALVLIDLQKGITALPTIHPADTILAQAARLARAFRERGLPVVRARVAFSADFGDALHNRVDAPMPGGALPPNFSDLREEVGHGPTDIVISKKNWDAFYGTELDMQLRRRRIAGVVIAGIATSLGVESTARHARELAYDVAIASDAVSDFSPEMHENSVTRVFPRLGHVDTTAAILTALSNARG